MGPFYTHCPHCSFPVVVKEAERVFARRCRQCREQYVPGLTGDSEVRNRHNSRHKARRLRARIRQRRRSLL